MPLFRDNPARSAVITAAALGVGYYVASSIESSQAFQLTTTSIAMLSVAVLMFMLFLNHQHEGRHTALSQSHTEYALIGAFAILWIVLLLGVRTYFGGGSSVVSSTGGVSEVANTVAATTITTKTTRSTRRPRPRDDWDAPPCRGDYCVYEEWTYY